MVPESCGWRRLCLLVAGLFALCLAACGKNRVDVSPSEGSDDPPKPLLITVFTAFGPDTKMQIVRVNTDGTERKPVTPKETFAVDPALSPDGKRLAYVEVNMHGENAGLYVMNLDGTGRTRIAQADHGEFLAPSWSPDGKRIAVCSADFNWKGTSLSPRLYVMDADGKNLKRLEKADGLMPTWSPDGKQLLFTQETDKGREAPSLCVADADGGNVRTLVKNGAIMGAFSPDGKALAYVVLESLHVRPGGMGLFVAKADGSEATRIAGGPDKLAFGVQWSADGKRLFFTTRDFKAPKKDPAAEKDDHKPEPPAVHVVDVDGTNLRRVTTGNDWEFVGGTYLLALLGLGRN